MMKLTAAAFALGLGIAWAAVPAIAQKTTREAIEQKADTVGDKMDRAWDKTKTKARDAKDKVKDKLGVSGRPSEDVRSAQQALQDKGFNPGRIDGVMGPRTTAAVKDFQQKESLNVTGSLDQHPRPADGLVGRRLAGDGPEGEQPQASVAVARSRPSTRGRESSRPLVVYTNRASQPPALTSLNTHEATSRASRAAPAASLQLGRAGAGAGGSRERRGA